MTLLSAFVNVTNKTMTCPIKDKFYYHLESLVGEEGAYTLYLANGDVIPNLKRDLRLSMTKNFSSAQITNLLGRLKSYNARFSSAHRIRFQQVGEADLFQIVDITEDWRIGTLKNVGTVATISSPQLETYPEKLTREELSSELFPSRLPGEPQTFVTDEGNVMSWPEYREHLRSRYAFVPDVNEQGNAMIFSGYGESKQFKALKTLGMTDDQTFDTYNQLKLLEQGKLQDSQLKDENGELTVLFTGNDKIHYESPNLIRGKIKALVVDSREYTHIPYRRGSSSAAQAELVLATTPADVVSFVTKENGGLVRKYIMKDTQGKYFILGADEADFLPDTTSENSDEMNQLKKMGIDPNDPDTWNNIPIDENALTVDDYYEEMGSLNTEEGYRFKKVVNTMYYALRKLKRAKYNAEKIGNIGLEQQMELYISDVEDMLTQFQDKMSRPSEISHIAPYAEVHLATVRKIVSKPDPTFAELLVARRYLNLWRASDEFLTDEDKDNEALMRGATDGEGIYEKGYRYFREESTDLDTKLTAKEQAFTVGVTRQTLQTGEIDVANLYAPALDISKWRSMSLDTLSVEHPLVQAIGKKIFKSNITIEREAKKIAVEVDKVYERAIPTLERLKPEGDTIFGIFKQKDINGNLTGDLLTEYRSEFYDTVKKLRQSVTWGDEDSMDKYFTWLQNNQLIFDVRKLFPDEELYNEESFTEQQREAHIKDLESQLGKERVEEILAQVEVMVGKFKVDREEAYAALDTQDIDDKVRELEKQKWDLKNSPYWFSRDFYETADASRSFMNLRRSVTSSMFGRIFPQGYNYTFTAPRKTTPTGETTGWSDPNFEILRKEENKPAYELYQLIVRTLNDMHRNLPYDLRDQMRYNSLPTIRKTVMEQYLQDGMAAGFEGFWNSMLEATRVDDTSNIYYGDQDPLTGEIEYSLDPRYIQDQEKVIRARVQQWEIDYITRNGYAPSQEETDEAFVKFRDEEARNKSWDLVRLAKAYSLMSLSMKHKEAVADELKFLHGQLKLIKRPELNEAGTGLISRDGEAIAVNNLEEYLNMVDSEMRRFFGQRKIEYVTRVKVLTSKEKAEKKEIERLLGQLEAAKDTLPTAEYDQSKEFLENRLSQLGGNVAGSKLMDRVIRYIQIKTLGWNPFSAVTNISFGQVAIAIEASANEHFGDKEMAEAYRIVLRSIGKFWGGGRIQDKQAMMTRALMDKFRLPGDQTGELYQSSPLSTFMRKFKWLLPFNLQRASEYVNYAPMMIASMKRKTVEVQTAEGSKTIPLWDAYEYDENTGYRWKSEYGTEPEEFIADYTTYLSVLGGKIHGNYDAVRRQSVKDSIWGRMLSVFRTWIFEGIETRWGTPDGYENAALAKTVKGRYRSYQALARTVSVNIGTTEVKGAPGAILFTLKQLLNKLMATARIKRGIVTEFDGLVGSTFTETDAANMRRNMSELYTIMAMYGFYLLLKHGLMDDDDRKSKWAYSLLLNQMFRLQQDMTFYVNPMSVEQLNQNIIPASGLVNDAAKWFGAVGDLIQGEDTYESGIYEGSSKTLRATAQLVPFANQPYKLYNLSQTLLDK